MGRHEKILTAVVMSLLATATATAQRTPAQRTPVQVVEHHIEALKKADIDQLVADYASNAVMVLPTGTFSGRVEIRKMFETYFAHDNPHLAWEATAEPRGNGVVIEHWTVYRGRPNESSGTDVIVVRGGKVVFHTMGPDAACKGKS